MSTISLSLNGFEALFALILSKQDRMGIRYNAATLSKIEKLVEESGYTLRYERGTFQSGYCILEARKVVVLNRFLQTEGRIHTLIDLISSLYIDPLLLSPENQKLLQELAGKNEPVADA